jgi:adenosine deaminase
MFESSPYSATFSSTVEHHRHLEAGMSPETIAMFADINNVDHVLTRNGKEPITGVDLHDPESIRAYYEGIAGGFSQPGGFVRFLDSFGIPVGVMRRLEDLQYATYKQIMDQADAGSIHTELRGSPYTYQMS